MFDKMSKRSYQNTTPTLPEEQNDPVTKWMADIPPLTKKTRAIHPRQRGHSNKHQQRHQQQNRQQHQPQQHQRHSAEQKSKPLQAPPQPLHNSIDDGLPKGKDFPLKEVRLEHQRMREMRP